MSISLRSQRVTIYAYLDIGTNGVVNAAYEKIAERWARIIPMSGKSIAIAAQVEHQIDAVISLAAEVDITENGLIQAEDGTLFRVVAILDRAMSNEQDVLVTSTDDSQFSILAPVASVTVTPNPGRVQPGNTLQMVAVLQDAQNNVLTGRTVLWTVSDPTLASIDANTGLLTAIALGTVMVTATAEGVFATVSVVLMLDPLLIIAGGTLPSSPGFARNTPALYQQDA